MSRTLLIFLVLVASFPLAKAGDAAVTTTQQKAVYEAINKAEATFSKSSAKCEIDGLAFELTGRSDAKSLRKIVARVPGEDGDGFEEFYLENGKIVFVLRSYQAATAEGKKPETMEDRFYFKDGKMVKWLAGKEKADTPPTDQGFQAEAERLLGNGAEFIKAFAAKTGKSKTTKEAPAAAKLKTTEGTFTGIEEGDYFHWGLKTKQGEETFFILDADDSVDAVLKSPKSFAGKRCRITWQTSIENIPQAGGKMEVSQIKSVEWLDKK
jgi:hypothetical protein